MGSKLALRRSRATARTCDEVAWIEQGIVLGNRDSVAEKLNGDETKRKANGNQNGELRPERLKDLTKKQIEANKC